MGILNKDHIIMSAKWSTEDGNNANYSNETNCGDSEHHFLVALSGFGILN
jgi:hypothetical protein